MASRSVIEIIWKDTASLADDSNEIKVKRRKWLAVFENLFATDLVFLSRNTYRTDTGEGVHSSLVLKLKALHSLYLGISKSVIDCTVYYFSSEQIRLTVLRKE